MSYHYTICGLDNIYLENGVEITQGEYGEEIFIHDLNGLHRAIGMTLVYKPHLLNGKEIRFMRNMMDLSQKSLGNLLGVDYQSVLGWEKGKNPISSTADHFLRVIFYAFINKNDHVEMYDFITELSDLDAAEEEQEMIQFEQGKNGWHLFAA